MLFTIGLYASLIIFGLGLLYRVSAWFRLKIGINAGDISPFERVLAAFRGILGTIFSARILTLLKALILDVILERRIIRENFLRWLMHICIYIGFTLLILMHALGGITSSNLFDNYYSTLNPFMFLRDFFGVLVIVGILIAIYRRFILRVPRLSTNAMDIYMIIIVCIIIVSGIFLEGMKITSYTRYQEMVEEYGAADDEKGLKALEAYWVKEFDIVIPGKPVEFDSAALQLGKEIHEMSCVECHSKPEWAFTGFATAKLIKPVARGMDEAGVPKILFIIHYLACFLALAYLPFSKMFHLITTPLSLLANAVMDENSKPANIATRQVMELDACTHCATCSLRCSALAAYQWIGNSNILPSEKMLHIKALINGKKLNAEELRALQEGVYLCTNCDRCTVVCPAGINLRDLWFQVREDLIQKNYPLPLVLSPLSFYRGLMSRKFDPENYKAPVDKARKELTSRLDEIVKGGITLTPDEIDMDFINELGLSTDAATYSYCFSCSTCTTSCPVVANYENPMDELGMLPHQIIHSAVLGLKDVSLGAKMLWDCLTCYKCQESCPQQVRIVEVFYKLKNLAVIENRRNLKNEGA